MWSRSQAWPPRGRAPCRPRQRDWRLFDVSVRAETLSRLVQPIREYLPEVSTALLVPDTRQALARAIQLQAVTDDGGASLDLLATVAAGEPGVVAQLNTLALDEWRPATLWQQPTIGVQAPATASASRQRSEPAGLIEERAHLAAEHGCAGTGKPEPRLERSGLPRASATTRRRRAAGRP